MTVPTPPTAPTKEPGPTFLTFLAQVDDGRLAANLTEEMELLIAELKSVAQIVGAKARGSITLTININAPSQTVMEAVGDIKRKMPRRPRAVSQFYATKHNMLTAVNPQQLGIPGIDVATQGRGELRRVD